MDAKPYFTIVIPAYNREREIRRAIDSCLSQGFDDYEIVVVDDGSRGQRIEEVGFRHWAANDHPDHSVIAAFRQEQLEKLAQLFV